MSTMTHTTTARRITRAEWTKLRTRGTAGIRQKRAAYVR